MRITVNGEARQVAGAFLGEALSELGYAGRKIATAVDGDFVPAARRDAHPLAEGSAIEIVAPMQGG